MQQPQQVQREFFKLYFDNLAIQAANATAKTLEMLGNCSGVAESVWEALPQDLGVWLPPPADATVNYTLWHTFIGPESARNLTSIREVALEVVENHVQVATFIFIVGAKLLVLFLMVVHHSGFWYLLAVALLNDLCVIVVGFLSISTRYDEDERLIHWLAL